MVPSFATTEADTISSCQDVEKAPSRIPERTADDSGAKTEESEHKITVPSSSNPQDWPSRRKWTATIIISCFSFNTMMTSTMIAPALSQISHDLDIKNESQTQLTLSSYVISYAFGPFLWAPLSELYGRVVVLQLASAWFLIWNLACGFARSKGVLIAARLMGGMGASAALAISSGMLSDCWRKDQRGRSLAVYTFLPLLGPAVGPIFGGIIAHTSTWRWSFWATSIFDALLQLFAFAFLHETHLPTLTRRQQRASSTRYSISQLLAESDTAAVATALVKALNRPVHLMLTQPVLQLLSVWGCVSFGILYIIISTLPKLFRSQYGQGDMSASLNYISFGIGFILGAQVLAVSTDRLYQRQTSPQPESRTTLLLPSIIIAGLGLICMGWSAQARTHWIVPNIGLVFFAAGIQFSTQCQNAYVIDVYGPLGWSASAMAGIWAFKSGAGFAFPLFGPAIYNSLGFGWGNSVLAAALMAVGIPVALALQLHGDVFRTMGQRKLEK